MLPERPVRARRNFLKATAAGIGTAELLRRPTLVPAHAKANSPRAKLDPHSELRVGMIGTSGHTGLVLDALPDITGARLVAYALKDAQRLENEITETRYADVFQTDIEQLKKHRAFRPDTKLYDTYQEMLAKEKLDIVGVCLPYAINAFASVAAVKRGIHILSEKPLATEMKDLELLRKAVDESGVEISAMLEMRLWPEIRTIREQVAQGVIGEPILATAQKSYKWGKTRPWFYKNRQTYGGTIPWIGIHAIDFVLHTTGLTVKSVAAIQGNKAHPEFPGTEDQVGVLLGLSNGGTAVITLDYLRPETADDHGDDRLRLAGNKGVIEMRHGKVELISEREPARMLSLLPRQSIFADFVAFLRGQGTHVIQRDELFEVNRICLLARQAADEKKIVFV
jgi:predicted dehydrogenase